MGKLRVHNIEAQTGTNVDLGAAGDNVTIASDSIQTNLYKDCLLYTSPSPRDGLLSRMPSSA